MLNQLKKIVNLQRLNNPYPYTARFPESFKTILFISWFIFFFVFFFRADQFGENISTPSRLLYASYYGFITFIVASINILLFSYFVKPEKDRDWKVWNEIILYVIHFITISLAINLLSIFVIGKEMSLIESILSIFTTILIGLIPVSIHVINEQKKLFKKHFELANRISDTEQEQESKPSKELIEIASQSYPIDDLLYFESNKNYLNIYLPNDKMVTIRFTIKEMENHLAKYAQFIRCHRAYIVNTEKVKNVEGNAQGLKLFLKEMSSYVPVSRSYIATVQPVVHPNR